MIFATLKKATFALVLAGTLLASGATAAQAPPTQPPIFAGPGGRMALSRWTLRSDPANRGIANGWARGAFSGRTVNLPNDVEPNAYNGRAGQRNYEGSVAWYRASFTATSAADYALDFQSANFQATVWVDGRALGSHRGSYLPFELRSRLTAGSHTVVVRIDWRHPAAQAQAGVHRTLVYRG